jgi:hypothetical protein
MSETPKSDNSNRLQLIIAVVGAMTTVLVALIGVLPNLIERLAPAPTPTPITIIAVDPTAIPPTLPSVVEPTAISPTTTPLPTQEATVANPPILIPTQIPFVANVRFLYDDVSFTVVNISGDRLTLQGVSFTSAIGSWQASQWGGNVYTTLPNGYCLRMRDATVGQRRPPSDCNNNIYGLMEVGGSAIFWLNTDTFDVQKDGVLLATCTVASGVCEVYLP